MVNVKRIKTKIPSLLLDTTTSNTWTLFIRKRNHFLAFSRKNPKRCDELMTKVVMVLKEIDKAVEARA